MEIWIEFLLLNIFNQKLSLHYMQGIIKKLTDKNFGFISQDDSEKDLFFHANNLEDVRFEELREGDAVTFEIENTPKGDAAVNVKRA